MPPETENSHGHGVGEYEMSRLPSPKEDTTCSQPIPQSPTTDAGDSTTTIQTSASAAAAADVHSTTIVDEAQECLAQALLMFLYADLRLLSATGRINTKFETLCIDSDRVPRTTAAELAQLPDATNQRNINEYCEGVSPGQIMAILIVELRQEVLAQRRRVKEQMKLKSKGPWVQNPLSEEEDDDESDDDIDDAGVMNKITDRKGRKEFETDMHALIRSYNNMLAQDLKGIPEVKLERLFADRFRRARETRMNMRKSAQQGGGGGGGVRPWLRPGGLTQRLFSFDDMMDQQQQQGADQTRDADSDDEGSKKSQGSVASLKDRLSIAARFTGSLSKSLQKKSATNAPTADINIVTTDETEKSPIKAEDVAYGSMDDDETLKTSNNTSPPKKKLSLIAESESFNDEQNSLRADGGPDAPQTPAGKMNQSRLFEIIDSFRGLRSTQADLQSLKSDPGPNHSWRGNNPELSNEDVSSRAPIQVEDGGGIVTPPPARRGTLTKQLTQHLKNYVQEYREDHALHNKLIIPTDDYETFAGAEDVGNKLAKLTSSLNFMGPMMSSVPESSQITTPADPSRNMSENELLDFMTKCIESRELSSLDFMADFFRDNTVSQTMVKSKAQVVWLQDWFPIKDCTYAISIDKKKKRVLVVFRGAITLTDWSHGFDAAMKKGHNPVKDDYEGKKTFLKYHRGFFTYLFRMRKDTSTRKYDEIANKVYEYGNKMIGSDFTVTVNGYSLGGALSVLFGFHASTDPRFTQNGPVKIFSYGAPYSVSHSFADAFRHQEKNRKVQHARFYNSNDIVAHMPFNAKPTHRGSNFVHVGIDVKLYPVPGSASLWGSRYPRFYYNKRQSSKAAYWRAIKLNSLLNTTFPWQIKNIHGLPELQKRIARAIKVSEAAKSSTTKNPYLQSTLDEAYEAMVYKK